VPAERDRVGFEALLAAAASRTRTAVARRARLAVDASG
jgi:hypothetical protein